jgi:hypothetical protein
MFYLLILITNRMKPVFLIFVIITGSFNLFAQQRADVKTPKGSNVIAYKPDEMSSSDRAYYDNYFSTTYPNATQITTYDYYSSSNRFNCHGYAWYMIESGSGLSDPRWIGYYYTTDEDIYMSDGSYIQVANEMYPGKVSWGSGDHTAVTTSQVGRYKSKWNKYPLFEHDWDDTPYGTNNLKFYVSTDINGSSGVLCNNSTRSFTTINIPGANYSWVVGNGVTLNSNGSHSTSVTTNTFFSGSSWIEVTITSPLTDNNYDIKTSKRVYFWIGKPGQPTLVPSGYPTIELNMSQYITIRAVSTPGYPTTYNWSVTGNPCGVDIFPASNGISCTFEAIEPSWNNFYFNTTNVCGTSPNAGGVIEVVEGGGGGMMKILTVSPNPANDYIEAYIENLTEEEQLDKEKLHIKIVNSNSIPVYNGTTQQKKFEINTSSFPEGVYYLLVQYKNQKYTTPILISR